MKPSYRLTILLIAAMFIGIIVMAWDPYLWIIDFVIILLVFVLAAFDFIYSVPKRLVELNFSSLVLPQELYIDETHLLFVPFFKINWLNTPSFIASLVVGPLLAELPDKKGHFKIGESANISFDLIPKKRGETTIDGLWLFWESPFRLFLFRKYFELNHNLAIYQNVRAVKAAANKLLSRDALSGLKNLNKLGAGSEFKAMREYTFGIDMHAIDWKQTAKHRKLIAKEFHVELNHHIFIAFDTGYLMSDIDEGISNLDYAINAGLFLTCFVLAAGDQIGVYSFDEKPGIFVSPISSLQKFGAIQSATAEITYTDKTTNFTLGLFELGKKLQKRSLVIVFSDFVDIITAEIMMQSISFLNKKHMILFVTFENLSTDRAVSAPPGEKNVISQAILADEFKKEQDKVYRSLKDIGVQTLTVKRKHVSIDLLNKYLEIKQKGLI